MKYIKLYDELNIDKPKVGDYVIMTQDCRFMIFSSNNIGQIIEYDDKSKI